MNKISKIKLILTGVLALVFTAGSIGIFFSAKNIGPSAEANIFRIFSKKFHSSASNNLVSQLEETADVSATSVSCDIPEPEHPVYQGEFLLDETKVWAAPGGNFNVYMYLKNTGNISWFGDLSGCGEKAVMRLGTARERDRTSIFYNPGDSRWLTPSRIAMVEKRVDPGEVATFAFSSYTPTVTDVFREYFQPVIEGKMWLERKPETAHVDIYAGDATEDLERRALFLGSSMQASALDLSGPALIDVDISTQKMQLKFGDTIVREYIVSTGTFKKPTPLGYFKILNKQDLRIAGKSPHYRMPMWQGFSKWGHGFHGLPYLANDQGIFWKEALNHIGRPVSHGCVRLLPEDAEEFFKLTDVGMDVIIHS